MEQEGEICVLGRTSRKPDTGQKTVSPSRCSPFSPVPIFSFSFLKFVSLFFLFLGIEPRPVPMLEQLITTEPCLQPPSFVCVRVYVRERDWVTLNSPGWPGTHCIVPEFFIFLPQSPRWAGNCFLFLFYLQCWRWNPASYTCKAGEHCTTQLHHSLLSTRS